MSDPGPPEQPPSPDGGGIPGSAKWAIALVAAVIAIVAFVVLQGGDDEGSSSPSPTTAVTAGDTATSEPASTTSTGTTSNPATTIGSGADTQTAPSETTTAPEPETATVRVVNGQPEGGVQTFKYRHGDRIRLRVISDTADEVHVHGYDLMQDVAAGGEVEFDFEATIEGRFEVELESSATQLALLEVQP